MSPELIAEELKKVQTINKNIFDSSPNIIFIKSVSGAYELVNKAMLECLGLSEEDLIGKTDDEIVSDKFIRETYKKEDKQVLDTGVALKTESVIHCVDNEKRWFQTVKSPIFAEAGEVIGLMGIVTDVTTLKLAEKKNKEQEKLLNTVFNSGTDFIAVIEAKENSYNYVSCNTAYINLLDYFDLGVKSSSDIIGIQFNKLATEKGVLELKRAKETCKNFKRVIKSKKPFSITEILEIPGRKEKLYIDVEISPILSDKNEVEYLIYRGRDFSEIMKYNIQLQEREELLQSINRNVQDGIYRSTIGLGLKYANDAMCKMFGYSLKDLSSTKPKELYAIEGDRERIIKELSKSGSFSNREVLFRRKDGSTFWASLSCSMTLEANGSRVIDGIIVDVTEKRKNREELKSINESLLKTNSELDHLVYRTSHDLRSPLASIMGIMELIRLEGIDGETAEYISIMEDQVAKLDKVILDIINIRIIAKSGLQHDNINCQEIIDNIFESIKFLDRFDAINKRVSIRQKTAFIQDNNNIQIILNNLLSNAVKYSKKEESGSYISVEVSIDENLCSLIIKDNGIGISKEHLTKVFDMFYRATDVNQGTGLGLFIVKEALDKLNGSIVVSSKEGEWTQFKIDIPNLIKE